MEKRINAKLEAISNNAASEKPKENPKASKENEASKVMDDIESLCQEIKETNPGVEIVLSELTTREDNPQAKKIVNEVNTLLENYCTATNM